MATERLERIIARPAARTAALILCIMPAAGRAAPLWVDDQPAVAAVGQQNLTSSGINGTPGVGFSGLFSPGGIWTDGSTLIVADTNNNRVLIYNTVPIANGTPADVVIGQQDSVSNSANQGGGPAQNTLASPTGVFFDGTNLYIADTGNNRILIFNAIPIDFNASANVVLGQPNFTSGAAGTGAKSMRGPSGVCSDGNSVYVADTGNHRVLIFNSIPGAGPTAAASVVVGQPSFVVGSANQGGGISSTTLSSPESVFVDTNTGKMFIADQGNNRLLIYNSAPPVNNAPATVVIGQTAMSSGTANQGGLAGAGTLSGPAFAYSNGSNLVVSDAGNNRVLIFNSIPAGNNAKANLVLGQSAMTAGTANQGGAAPSANTLARPLGVISDGTALYVADRANNRALIFNPFPTATNATANIVVGQSDFITGTPNQSLPSSTSATLNRPGGTALDSSRAKLFVADRLNHRVLIFNQPPTASNTPADVVIGQPDMVSNLANNGGAGANTLFAPAAARTGGSRLFVADQLNNRVLIFNSIPTTNHASASVVVGQATSTSTLSNRGGVVSTNTLSSPAGVFSDGNILLVADSGNNRVLIYNPIPSSNNAGAAVVLGQALMTKNRSNQGAAAAGQTTLSSPSDVFYDGSRIFIADQMNNRVLIFNSLPAVNNSSANVVIGQPNFISNSFNQGIGPRLNTLGRPTGVYSDGASLYIADAGNNRILVYNSIPSANNAAADVVIGQSTGNLRGSNQGSSAAADTLSAPSAVAVDSSTGRMFVADAANNRVLLLEPAVAASLTSAGGTVTLNSPIEPIQAQAVIPAGAFNQTVSVTVSAASGFPAGASTAGIAKASNVGFEIATDKPVQPAANVTLYATYLPADLAGLDLTKLILARYDGYAGIWVPLESTTDMVNHRVIAQTNHFSLFEIMQVDPTGNAVSNARVFPNPFQPSQGQTYVTFTLLPPGARIRIYTESGVLINDFSADPTGLAHWDGSNKTGLKVASGIYTAFIQGGGQTRTLRVAVQR